MATKPNRKRVAKKKPVKRRRTTKDPVLTKIDYWSIAANEVFKACRRAGMDDGLALAFAMDKTSWPDWIIDPVNPIVSPLDDFDEDE